MGVMVLIPCGGINEGGQPIEGAKWNYGNHELELILYTPHKSEAPNGKFIILERRQRGVVVLRAKVGIIDFVNTSPLILYEDYSTKFIDSIGDYVRATYLLGIPALEWAIHCGRTFLTEWQKEAYDDWEWTQEMQVTTLSGESDSFTTIKEEYEDTLDETIWGIDDDEDEPDDDTEDAG